MFISDTSDVVFYDVIRPAILNKILKHNCLCLHHFVEKKKKERFSKRELEKEINTTIVNNIGYTIGILVLNKGMSGFTSNTVFQIHF